MIMEKDHDVIIIGAGNGGLSAAVCLGKAGKKVLVLEKNALPGGCATSFRRGRFEFEASLHEMCSMGPEKGQVRRLLDFYGLDVEWVAVNEAFRSIDTDPETGFDVTMPVGVKGFVDRMEQEVPGSRASMETVMEMSRMLTDGVEWLDAHNNEPQGLAKIQMMMKFADLMKIVPVPTDTMLRTIGVPDRAREIYESYWDYIGVDSTRMSFAVYAYMTYTYITQRPWICKDRSHEISLAFDKRIRELGGDIWYKTEVRKIDIRDHVVKGVELADGTYLACERVLSNVMPTVVFDRMVDPAEVPARDRKLIKARRLAQSAFTVCIGLDIPYEQLGFKGYDTFVRTTGDNAVQFQHAQTIPTHRDYCVTILNAVIPDCSPEGTCIVQLTKLFSADAFADVTEKDYFKVKEQIAEETIRDLEELADIDIRDHIEEIEITTPVTWARYLGTPQGNVYGYAAGTWDGMFPRVQSAHKLDYTVKGLRFAGGHGSQMDGYSQAYLSGREQARYMLEDMKEGK